MAEPEPRNRDSESISERAATRADNSCDVCQNASCHTDVSCVSAVS